MRYVILLMIGMCVSIPVLAETVQLSDTEDSASLGLTVDATWVSKYMWKGFDLYDDHVTLG